MKRPDEITPDELMRDTEHYVRDCFRILGDRHDEETVMLVTRKLAVTMALEIAKRQLELAALDACFTPEEQQRLKDTTP